MNTSAVWLELHVLEGYDTSQANEKIHDIWANVEWAFGDSLFDLVVISMLVFLQMVFSLSCTGQSCF